MAEDEHIHDENCDHDHDDEGEIEITINPREEDLTALGVSPEEFETALMATLDAYDKTIEAGDSESVTPLEDAEITLGGKVYALHEVADIEISDELEPLGDDDDDDDDDDFDDDEEELDDDDEEEEADEVEEDEHHD